MIVEDQSRVLTFLGSAGTHGGAAVDRIDTHASVVFLAGDTAWKLKRAVRFDYLDYSTAARRRAASDAELRLNRRTAASIYRRVVAITEAPDGTLGMGGDGAPVDWVVEMRRFPQEALFADMASRGALPLDLMAPLGRAVARFHRDAAHRSDHGGARGMAWVVDGNAAGLAEAAGPAVDAALARHLTDGTRTRLARDAAMLDARRGAGFVRECHGDLHLGNIVLVEGVPTLFDAVEFNDEIACVDTLYDLAFLLMDLWHRGLHRHANEVLNAYVQTSNERDGLALLPLFLSCRAAIRAKTSAAAALVQADAERRVTLRETAAAYLSLAPALLEASPPALVAIGGWSGSGKSWLAREVAASIGPAPGAIVLRSDELRKRMIGRESGDRLGPDAYTPAISRRVYDEAATRAADLLTAGHAVLIDAVFGDARNREMAAGVAARAGVPFVGIWLDVPLALRLARVTARCGDVSDADADVVARQETQDPGEVRWHRLDATASSPSLASVAAQVIAAGISRG